MERSFSERHEIELHHQLLTIIQGPTNHGLIPPLRRLRHTTQNHSPQRPPVCCLYLGHWGIIPSSRPSMAHQGSIWYIMGIFDRRCRSRRLQGLPRQSTNSVPSCSRSKTPKVMERSGYHRARAWPCACHQ